MGDSDLRLELDEFLKQVFSYQIKLIISIFGSKNREIYCLYIVEKN